MVLSNLCKRSTYRSNQGPARLPPFRLSGVQIRALTSTGPKRLVRLTVK